MAHRHLPLLAVLVLCLTVSAAVTDDRALSGYSADSARAERDWETKFRAIPNADNQREYMKRLSARPHNVGTPYDQDNAEWLLAKMKEWGLDAHIENFDVLFPTPKERAVELVEPTKFTAWLNKPPFSTDPISIQQAERLPTSNPYSPDGVSTPPLST